MLTQHSLVKIIVIVITCATLGQGAVLGYNKVSYVGHKLIRTSTLPNSKMASDLLSILDGKQGINFWTFPHENRETDILISPEVYKNTQNLILKLGLDFEELHDDIDVLLQAENPQYHNCVKNTSRQASAEMNWRNYQRYSVILRFCQTLAQQNGPNKKVQVKLETIGKTTEKRDIVLLKISNNAGSSSKPAIWIDGGMHAREWISPATVTYILNTLVNDQSESEELLNAFDWYVVPVINADGYEYTWTANRFWRKTRSRTNSPLGCRGVDPNRNWGFQWGGEGSSSDPCSDTYRGPKAFSEPETQAVSQAILARKNQIKMYLTFHSYSQLLLVPWGYSRQKPRDYDDLLSLGVKGKQALEATSGTEYKIGTAPDLIYVAAGGSDDWAKGGAEIKYSYTFELRDTGKTGFALPSNQIIPTGRETFNAVKALALNLKGLL